MDEDVDRRHGMKVSEGGDLDSILDVEIIRLKVRDASFEEYGWMAHQSA